MRLCRFEHNGNADLGFYLDNGVASFAKVAALFGVDVKTHPPTQLLDLLPPEGKYAAAVQIFERFRKLPADEKATIVLAHDAVQLRVPIAHPSKVILLAGNYAEHVKEGGGDPVERENTFPYFFWKPPVSTLTHPGDPIRIPKISPDHVDWEVELGVIIGRRCQGVSEANALKQVAGYTICNDVSDRKFQINPQRKVREKDKFFDWLHGKWHNTFLPMGPCVLPASATVDPQKFVLRLRVNDRTMQDGTTRQMIFPVAALIASLSSFMTLEPGDVISTGTPAGVGFARTPPVFLKAGDRVEAEIEGIGILRNPVV